LTLNISETVRDTDIVSMEYLHTPYSIMSFPITLSDLEWLSKNYSVTRSIARSLCDSRATFWRVRSFSACVGRSLLLIAICY